MEFPVYAERCAECLFSKDKIVSDDRRKDLLAGMAKKGGWFICHKASLIGERVCCKGFYDTKSNNDLVIAERLGMIKFVPLPDAPAVGAKDTPTMIKPPEGFVVIGDVNERVQNGDMFYDREDEDWYYVTRKQTGSYVSQHAAICRIPPGDKVVCIRALPAKPVVQRVMRTRRPNPEKK